jgi:2-(1,2-epoxy-1,2-dihydrophenyl)acetyl-CoA isomerase
MNYEEIKLEFVDSVAVLTLNNPTVLNAISRKMIMEMTDAMGWIEDPAKGARCLLITGTGRAFSAGANLNDPDRNPKGDRRPDSDNVLEKWYNPLFLRLSELKMPCITAINGVAAGVGMSFALAGDLALAARSAYFLQAFRRIGLIPDGGATFTITRLIGKMRTMELMLLGEKLPVEKALEWGMINRIYNDEELMPEAMKLARALADGPTLALGLMRRACWLALDNRYIEQLWVERHYQAIAGKSEDNREGVAAFREKRPAKFKGR